uniref:Shikimate dehydrogenase substrate binding domain protein n=1 Tax=Caulobacter sp. (strain K31) TaxID=366602 RepID=B0T7H0_CAUSK
MTSSSTTPQITGATKVCAILADPIHQVRTPQAFNALMRQWNQDAVLVPLHVVPAKLETAIRGLRQTENLAGFAVTVPHKAAVLRWLDEASAHAHAVGAVNVVRREADGRLVGDVLDGVGFVAGLRQSGIDLRGMNVFMAGAGGAANAIAFSLAAAGIASLGIWNRTGSKSEDLRERLLRLYPELPIAITNNDPTGADLVINATSLGLREGDPAPLDLERLQAHQVVAEVIMKPAMTSLLLAAEARGCQICLGAPMLDCQLTLMAEFMGFRP